jgi:8-oxo-dGTP pyrophosphatase MutT (NUDIX family)
MDETWVNHLRRKLSGPLPGIEAQLRLSPPGRHMPEPDRPARKSAVLVVLYSIQGKLSTVFIKRTEYNGVHSGQVSLPGGMYKESDENLERTALRETHEEIGVPEKELIITGRLTSLHIPVSGIIVFPFVAVCSQRPEFVPDPFEVKYLIETGVEELLDKENHKQKIMLIGDREIEIPYFDIHGDQIWGATAMIMSEFLEIIKNIL